MLICKGFSPRKVRIRHCEFAIAHCPKHHEFKFPSPTSGQLRCLDVAIISSKKMAAVTGCVKVCETLGCGNDARLQCPTCIKLGIQGSYFCSQVQIC